MRKINFEDLEKDVQNLMDKADAAHDFSHIGRVVRTSLSLAQGLDADLDAVRLIALLHDVDDRKVSPENGHRAVKLLEKYGVERELADVVLEGWKTSPFRKGISRRVWRERSYRTPTVSMRSEPSGLQRGKQGKENLYSRCRVLR